MIDAFPQVNGVKGLLRIVAVVFLGMFGICLVCPIAFAAGDASRFAIPFIKYEGGNPTPRPKALESLLAQIANRTSIEVKRDSIGLKFQDPRLFRYPFVYLGGDQAFDPPSDKDLNALRTYLTYGGFLLIDDNSGNPDSGFDASVREMIARLFPHTPLKQIGRDHSVFRSFYLINQVTGRVRMHPWLEGVTLKGRTVLVYSSNDLAGAWSRGKLGHWDFDMVGGGQRQRTLSIRMGINIVMYSLTLDYKKDMVHLPIILDRLRRYNPR